MSNIQAILWDNDGVLVDSETVFFKITRCAFARLGLELTEEIWATQYLGHGKGSKDIAECLGAHPAEINSVLKDRNEQYLIALGQPPEIRPKVRETLATLYGRVRMAIVTGCPRKELNLMHEQSGLLEFFETVLTADDYDDPKPSPAPYLAAVNALSLNATNCIAVEDSRRGFSSAIAAGIACMVVPTELTAMQDFSGSLAVEPDVSGILRYVE